MSRQSLRLRRHHLEPKSAEKGVREAYRKARCHDEGAEEAAVLGGFDADAAEDKGVVEVEPRRGGAGDFLGGCGGLQAFPHRFRVHGGGAPGGEEGRPRHLIRTRCRVGNQDARSSEDERRLLQSVVVGEWGIARVIG